MESIDEFVAERGILEVLHFTTNRGLVGILAAGALLSRNDLNAEDLLEDVKLLNCSTRKDPAWAGHVNLSISAVNKDFLKSSTGWHPPRDDLWWLVLAFSPKILSDAGVIFTTTNNVYHQTVRRADGIDGLKAMFAPAVPHGYFGSVARRLSSTPAHLPTHLQAEVLYPGRIDISHLEAIYVPEDEHIDDVRGLLASLLGAPIVRVEVRPEVFL